MSSFINGESWRPDLILAHFLLTIYAHIYMYYIHPELRIWGLPFRVKKASKAAVEEVVREQGGVVSGSLKRVYRNRLELLCDVLVF